MRLSAALNTFRVAQLSSVLPLSRSRLFSIKQVLISAELVWNVGIMMWLRLALLRIPTTVFRTDRSAQRHRAIYI